MGGAVGGGRGSEGWEGQWEMGGAVGDGRGSEGWEGQWEMGGAVRDGRGSGRWEVASATTIETLKHCKEGRRGRGCERCIHTLETADCLGH